MRGGSEKSIQKGEDSGEYLCIFEEKKKKKKRQERKEEGVPGGTCHWSKAVLRVISFG